MIEDSLPTATRTGSTPRRRAGSSTVYRLTSSPGSGPTAVRPDGYIGFRCQTAEIRQLAAWLARLRATTCPEDPDPGVLRF